MSISKPTFPTTDRNSNSLWNWNPNDRLNKKKKKKKKGDPFPEFLQDNCHKVEETLLGPGGGIGIGCGVGAGFGLVGGLGYGGWPWNHVQLVFGVGMGCGIGFGFGYGGGLGYGFSWESLMSKRRSKSNPNKRRLVIEL